MLQIEFYGSTGLVGQAIEKARTGPLRGPHARNLEAGWGGGFTGRRVAASPEAEAGNASAVAVQGEPDPALDERNGEGHHDQPS